MTLSCYNQRMASSYLVKEIFGPTLQGEGAHAGMPCVFLRFAECNLACSFCDTVFSAEGASRMDAALVVRKLVETDIHEARRVVVTGGEPTLQWDGELYAVMKRAGFSVHMETNGTHALAAPVDWLTVSPKPQFHGEREKLVVTGGDECKLIAFESTSAAELQGFEGLDFARWYLQPCTNERYDANLRAAIALTLARPRWRLSLQLHKLLGLP